MDAWWLLETGEAKHPDEFKRRVQTVKWFFLVCVCITAATLISMSFVSSADAQSTIGDEGYRYEVGDKILLTVPERPSMNRELVINEAGAITLPLAGDIEIVGLTTHEAHEKMFQTLHDFYPSLKKTDFSIEAVPGVVVYVTGEVSTPGRYSFANAPKLWEAIREAGGPTGRAALDIVRIVDDEEEGGESHTVNVLTAVELGTTDDLPLLKDGDTVVLLSADELYVGAAGVNVYGAVPRPGFYRLKGEHQDLMSAIVLAGGPTPRASLSSVKIIREGENGEPITISYNLKKFLDDGDPESNPILQPGDTINVPEQNPWSYQLKNNFGIILSIIATTATVFLVIDRMNN